MAVIRAVAGHGHWFLGLHFYSARSQRWNIPFLNTTVLITQPRPSTRVFASPWLLKSRAQEDMPSHHHFAVPSQRQEPCVPSSLQLRLLWWVSNLCPMPTASGIILFFLIGQKGTFLLSFYFMKFYFSGKFPEYPDLMLFSFQSVTTPSAVGDLSSLLLLTCGSRIIG